MSTPQDNIDNQEIDLMVIFKSIRKGFQNINRSIFNAIQFVIKHKIIIGSLFLFGIALGFYLDKEQKNYKNELIVQPNFKSVDYLYSKIDLIDSKIKEGDTLFLKSIGIQEPKKLSEIKIKPVVDVYEFVNPQTGVNPEFDKKFEMFKLFAEDGDIKKVVEEKVTSKNYIFHKITFKTKGKTATEKTFKPLLNYLNNDKYFEKVQKGYVNNVHEKIKANNIIISQIDAVLNSFSNRVNANSSNDKLMYFNENAQLNDILYNKDRLTKEQGKLRLDLLGYDKIIKENIAVLNIKDTEKVNGKMKLILPFLFLFMYLVFYQFKSFYKSQLAKSKEQ